MDYLFDLIGWSESLPRWQRPIVNGALLVGAFVLTRLGGFIGIPILLLSAWYHAGVAAAGKALLLFPGAILAGALAGAVYVGLAPLRLLAKPGVWASWVAASAVYIACILTLFNGLFPEPGMALSEPEGRFILVGCSVFTGSACFWIFGGDDDLPHSIAPRSTKDVLAHAVEADLAELAQSAATDPLKAQSLRQIRDNVPSSAVVSHWWRVVGRIGREGAGYMDLPHQWAQDRAEARLRRAQRRWEAARPLSGTGDA